MTDPDLDPWLLRLALKVGLAFSAACGLVAMPFGVIRVLRDYAESWEGQG